MEFYFKSILKMVGVLGEELSAVDEEIRSKLNEIGAGCSVDPWVYTTPDVVA